MLELSSWNCLDVKYSNNIYFWYFLALLEKLGTVGIVYLRTYFSIPLHYEVIVRLCIWDWCWSGVRALFYTIAHLSNPGDWLQTNRQIGNHVYLSCLYTNTSAEQVSRAFMISITIEALLLFCATLQKEFSASLCRKKGHLCNFASWQILSHCQYLAFHKSAFHTTRSKEYVHPCITISNQRFQLSKLLAFAKNKRNGQRTYGARCWAYHAILVQPIYTIQTKYYEGWNTIYTLHVQGIDAITHQRYLILAIL